jgi:hypothetical protein
MVGFLNHGGTKPQRSTKVLRQRGIKAKRHEASVNHRPDEQGFMKEEGKTNSQWK